MGLIFRWLRVIVIMKKLIAYHVPIKDRNYLNVSYAWKSLSEGNVFTTFTIQFRLLWQPFPRRGYS